VTSARESFFTIEGPRFTPPTQISEFVDQCIFNEISSEHFLKRKEMIFNFQLFCHHMLFICHPFNIGQDTAIIVCFIFGFKHWLLPSSVQASAQLKGESKNTSLSERKKSAIVS
jgi:hypothetical protein